MMDEKPPGAPGTGAPAASEVTGAPPPAEPHSDDPTSEVGPHPASQPTPDGAPDPLPPPAAMDEEQATDDETMGEATPVTAPEAGSRETAAEQPAPSDGEALLTLVQRVDAGVAALARTFEDKLAYDAHKDAQIDRLHQELQGHKRDLLGRALRPFITGMIRMHDQLGRTIDGLAAKPVEDQTPERFFSVLSSFGEDITDLLEQNGIESFEQPTERFDPVRQTAWGRVPTTDESLVGCIAERRRPGFSTGETVLQKERVAVYVRAPQTGEEAS